MQQLRLDMFTQPAISPKIAFKISLSSIKAVKLRYSDEGKMKMRLIAVC